MPLHSGLGLIQSLHGLKRTGQGPLEKQTPACLQTVTRKSRPSLQPVSALLRSDMPAAQLREPAHDTAHADAPRTSTYLLRFCVSENAAGLVSRAQEELQVFICCHMRHQGKRNTSTNWHLRKTDGDGWGTSQLKGVRRAGC